MRRNFSAVTALPSDPPRPAASNPFAQSAATSGSRPTSGKNASPSPSRATAGASSTATTAHGQTASVPLTPAALAWAASRGISQKTLEAFGARCATEIMPDLGRAETIALPYRRGSSLVAVKYRAIAGKAFKMRQGDELRFWNLDAVLGGDREAVYIFEGEMDAL